MRINVYSQELTEEVELVAKESNTGLFYHAVRLMLHSSDMLHHPPMDDDRSAITLWLPRSKRGREALASTLRRMADLVDSVPPEGEGISQSINKETHISTTRAQMQTHCYLDGGSIPVTVPLVQPLPDIFRRFPNKDE